jgi:hypothetical protein
VEHAVGTGVDDKAVNFLPFSLGATHNEPDSQSARIISACLYSNYRQETIIDTRRVLGYVKKISMFPSL